MKNKNTKNFFLIQWMGSVKYYVKGTYCGRVLLSSQRGDVKYFIEKDANKYLEKLKKIDTYGEFSVRQSI